MYWHQLAVVETKLQVSTDVMLPSIMCWPMHTIYGVRAVIRLPNAITISCNGYISFTVTPNHAACYIHCIHECEGGPGGGGGGGQPRSAMHLMMCWFH